MKRLFLVGGTMGVGKTTTCQILKKQLPNAVFLDGDWCWDAEPFQVTDETKTMVLENICFLLNQFLHCSAYENVIFCWVMHEQSILDTILSRLDVENCQVLPVSLICRAEVLEKRLQKDIVSGIRKPDIIERSVQRISLYTILNTVKIDVSDISPEKAAEAIANL